MPLDVIAFLAGFLAALIVTLLLGRAALRRYDIDFSGRESGGCSALVSRLDGYPPRAVRAIAHKGGVVLWQPRRRLVIATPPAATDTATRRATAQPDDAPWGWNLEGRDDGPELFGGEGLAAVVRRASRTAQRAPLTTWAWLLFPRFWGALAGAFVLTALGMAGVVALGHTETVTVTKTVADPEIDETLCTFVLSDAAGKAAGEQVSSCVMVDEPRVGARVEAVALPASDYAIVLDDLGLSEPTLGSLFMAAGAGGVAVVSGLWRAVLPRRRTSLIPFPIASDDAEGVDIAAMEHLTLAELADLEESIAPQPSTTPSHAGTGVRGLINRMRLYPIPAGSFATLALCWHHYDEHRNIALVVGLVALMVFVRGLVLSLTQFVEVRSLTHQAWQGPLAYSRVPGVANAVLLFLRPGRALWLDLDGSVPPRGTAQYRGDLTEDPSSVQLLVDGVLLRADRRHPELGPAELDQLREDVLDDLTMLIARADPPSTHRNVTETTLEPHSRRGDTE